MSSKDSLKKFFEWVRSLPCCICGSGYWDLDKGMWRNTVSHIKTKGSGGKDFDNVVPMCLINYCHQQFELKTRQEKQELVELANEYTRRFYEVKLL